MKRRIKIEGMMCKHCVAHVTKALLAVNGVESVEVSLEEGTATVSLNADIANEQLVFAIVEAGYEVIALDLIK